MIKKTTISIACLISLCSFKVVSTADFYSMKYKDRIAYIEELIENREDNIVELAKTYQEKGVKNPETQANTDYNILIGSLYTTHQNMGCRHYESFYEKEFSRDKEISK